MPEGVLPRTPITAGMESGSAAPPSPRWPAAVKPRLEAARAAPAYGLSGAGRLDAPPPARLREREASARWAADVPARLEL